MDCNWESPYQILNFLEWVRVGKYPTPYRFIYLEAGSYYGDQVTFEHVIFLPQPLTFWDYKQVTMSV